MKKWIEPHDIKSSVENLRLSDESKTRIVIDCYNRSRPHHCCIKKWQVVGTAMVVGFCVFCSPAAANIRYSLKDWLEQMTSEKVQSIYDSVQEQTVGAASTSRDYSDEERLRKNQLEELYKKGEMFPEREVAILDEGQEPESDQVSYQIADSLWILPERALTDEDLLEIIDYEYKMSYSLISINEANSLAETVVNPIINKDQALQTAQNFITSAYQVEIKPENIFIETYSDGTYEIKYSGLETREGSKADCSILISGVNGKIQNLHYDDKKHTAASEKDTKSVDQMKWYEKGKKIIFDIVGETKITSAWCLLYTGQDNTKEITKRIYYLYELEDGDTYTLGFLYSDGILQSLALGDSYLKNQKEYHSGWKFKADRADATYEIEKIGE